MTCTSKTAEMIKRWYYSASHWRLGDVMVVNITFLSFLLFSMCKSIHDAVNTWINYSFFILIILNSDTSLFKSRLKTIIIIIIILTHKHTLCWDIWKNWTTNLWKQMEDQCILTKGMCMSPESKREYVSFTTVATRHVRMNFWKLTKKNSFIKILSTSYQQTMYCNLGCQIKDDNRTIKIVL